MCLARMQLLPVVLFMVPLIQALAALVLALMATMVHPDLAVQVSLMLFE